MQLLFRLGRIIINSFALVLLIVLAYVMWQTNPSFSFILALAAVDQFEDVYYYVYKRRLFPNWFMPFDIIFEVILFGIGLGMLVFSISYYVYFETWFFRALLPLSIMIMYSSLEDIVLWRQPMPEPPSPSVAPSTEVMHYVCPKEEVRKEKRFVRRKHQ